jgi:Ca-activated chloride channel family protein
VNEALLGALQMVWEANTGGVERTQRPTMMVFLTDGLPTVGETNVEQILEKVARNNNFDGQKARIFTFGVGNDVNTNLLDGLAAKNKGASQYVREGEDIEVAVSSFFTKVSRPVLSNLKLDFGGIQASKMYPREIPDLFAGSTLTIFGRYEGNGKATVTLTGETDATAEPGAAKYEYPLEFPEGEKANDFLPRLWASRRIGYLLDEMRLHGESDELKDEVVELSLKYGIMTPYTSYLVLEKNSPLRAEVTRLSQRQQTTFPDQRRYSVAGQQGPAGPPGQITEEEVGAGLKSQEGAQAVAASVEVQGMKQTEQAQPAPEEIDAANLVNLARLQQERKAPQEALALQQVGDKSFVQIDSAWVDLEAQNQEGAAVMGIQYLSDAYFEAVSLVPDLGKYFALGERVTLRIGNLIIQVVEPQEEGQTLTDEQREQLKGGQP